MRLRDALPCSSALFLSFSPALAQTWENPTPHRTWLGEAGGDQFGWVCVSAGDIDGDGIAEVLVGAPFQDTQGNASGSAYLYSAVTGQRLALWRGSAAGANLGFSVAGGGDLDGDGVRDPILGAAATGGATAGEVQVRSGVDGTLLRSFVGQASGDTFGYAVAGDGDIDLDGVSDIVVGAPSHDGGGSNAGRVYAYSGASGALLHVWDGLQPNHFFGSGVAILPDRDGDGHAEILVGAPGAGPQHRGRAYLYSGADGAEACHFDADATGGGLGNFFLGSVGDLDGDSIADLFVSDFTNSALGSTTGRVYVYSGGDCSLYLTLTGERAGEGFGIGRGLVGDVDGDQHDDLLFGAWASSSGANAAGKFSLHSGVDGHRIGRYTGFLPGAGLGFDAAGIGDVDQDGHPDYLVSAATQAGGRGAVYVCSGRPLPPASYCDAVPNSSGVAASLDYAQSTSIALDRFELRAQGLVPGEATLFFYGALAQDVPFGDGRLCIVGPHYRLAPALLADAQGGALRPLDFQAPPAGSGPGAIQAGSTWCFQAWYRDPHLAGGSGYNLSSGLRATFFP